ncbi:MAG: EVE domain-containing protein [Deltaproteobacteria bacterium]|nr:EVE domain-containing protein [Deltaproteobacteria bacterium]
MATKKLTAKAKVTTKAKPAAATSAALPTRKPAVSKGSAPRPSAPKTWLVKSEPHVYSIDALARDGKTAWTGVRNYQARNFMRDDMKVGELVLFYHSSSEPPGVAGLARVASEAYPDPTQFDRASEYHDPAATLTEPRWMLVELAFVERFARYVSLAELKESADLEGMLVLQRGQRLSVQPVDLAHCRAVMAMGGARTRLP